MDRSYFFVDMTKRLLTIFLLLVILPACAPATPLPATTGPNTPAPTKDPVEPRDWWREAVFYEIFVRSFYDTDGDGIGDFNGVTQKLGYLQDLGITAIWLMPIHPSPSYHGYDVLNYFNVNPEYGTLADFTRLLVEAHQRGMHIIIDLVINHTSSGHPFFVAANSDPTSPYRGWYVWSDTDPGNGWHQGSSGFYFGLFCDCMPDLNYRNPEVTAFMENVVNFWLGDIGVDGFRVDAAKHLIEEGKQRENTQATHTWYRDFYRSYKANFPEAYMVGEVFGAGSSVVKSYTGDQLDQVFNFEMSSGMVNGANAGASSGINSAIQFALADMPDFNFATFLTNHDQNRVMSVLNGDMDKAKVAASLLLTSPGTPFLYYGEEIGMQGRKPDEDIRLPMQWSGEENAGFSGGRPWRSPGANFPQVNVEAQRNDPDSLLSHYRALIQLRQSHPALSGDGIQLVNTGHPGVYASLRYNENEALLVLVNLTGEPIEAYVLNLDEDVLNNGTYNVTLLLGKGEIAQLRVDDGKFNDYVPLKVLPPHSTFVMQFPP
jgi:alpha-amylase